LLKVFKVLFKFNLNALMQKTKFHLINSKEYIVGIKENECHEITGKTLLLIESLIEYYSKNINILTNIITQKNILSLRILDWLVTNYAKKI